jgi:hypothetical protein
MPSDAPSPEQILARYVQAMGGASAVEKLSTRVEKGSIDISGRQFPVELFSKTPGKRVLIIHLPNGDNITALDGTSGWTSPPGRPTREIPASEMLSARLEADLQLAIHFQQFFSEMKSGNPEKIRDHDVYVVTGSSAGEVVAKFYFDEHSGLLLRMLRYSDSPIGRNPTQVDYSDYRDQGKVKVPFQPTISTPRSRYSIRIERVRDNVPFDETIFARPAAAPLGNRPLDSRSVYWGEVAVQCKTAHAGLGKLFIDVLMALRTSRRPGIFSARSFGLGCRSSYFRGFRVGKNRTDHYDQGKCSQHQESGPENHRNQLRPRPGFRILI